MAVGEVVAPYHSAAYIWKPNGNLPWVSNAAIDSKPHIPEWPCPFRCPFRYATGRPDARMICHRHIQSVVEPLYEPPGQSPHPLAALYFIPIKDGVIQMPPDLAKDARILRQVMIENDMSE
jgi:hypothetical protein